MKTKFILITMLLCIFSSFAEAQKDVKARELLDKTAAIIDSEKGVEIKFDIASIVNKQQQNKIQGCISIKKNKFFLQLPSSKTWFDGKTQWTYMKKSQEVNISTPTEAQQQSMNPYKFINIYKNGFKLGVKNVSGGWQVHLYATNQKRTIKEMYVTIGKNYYPKTIKMRQSNGWTTINVSNFKPKNLSDSMFRFNAKDYPHAEVIDLR